ncbi:unnamed protein product [Gongylonema pulchrum]|uniref:ANK_REP_REGION domain-containing protein n=1 Tax=Gongylonema pulchrum TaxID=637853 RepID=A0A183CZX3_9BILA|nr:unnamed protein product [Gongylonema pulchrum]
MPERRKYQAADENEILNSSEIQSIYGAVRLNSVSALRQLLDDNEAKKENLLKYIRENKFPPDGSTLLHLASRRGFVEIITLAQNRAVRQAFSRFRSEHPDAFNWKISQIPEIVESSEEYLAAKKQIQREKKKQLRFRFECDAV